MKMTVWVRQALDSLQHYILAKGGKLTDFPVCKSNLRIAKNALLGGFTAVIASCQGIPALAQMPTLSDKILGMERSLETEFETYVG